MTEVIKNIYQRINAVMQDVIYIQKDKQVSGGGASYKAVTHDQAVSVVRASMVTHGIAIVPAQLSGEFLVMRDMNATPAPVKMGLYTGTYVIKLVNIDDPKDFSEYQVQAHAQDNGDKAPGKAMTYAVKTIILKAFLFETGENDESREDIKEKAKTITPEQAAQLAEYCFMTDENGNPQWSRVGRLLSKSYKIQSIQELLSINFEAALIRCKKAASNASD